MRLSVGGEDCGEEGGRAGAYIERAGSKIFFFVCELRELGGDSAAQRSAVQHSAGCTQFGELANGQSWREL